MDSTKQPETTAGGAADPPARDGVVGRRRPDGALPMDPPAKSLGYRTTKWVTLVGLFLNLILSAIKIMAGIWGNSQAVVADGFHSLSDSFTDIAVLMGLEFWSAPPDEDHPYGHGRIETIVTVLIGLALAFVGLGLGYQALRTMAERHNGPPGLMAFWAALLSIFTKEWLFRWTYRSGRMVGSPALIANAWHHRSDALSSIPVVVAIGVSRAYPSWNLLDHVAAVLVSFFILEVAWRIIRPGLRELIDTGANRESLDRIEKLALGVPGVLTIHALRSRYYCNGLQVDLHIQVLGEMTVREGHRISHQVRKVLLENGPEIRDVLIHIEPYDEADRLSSPPK